ncbi:response regulator [Desulfatitalea alkaliphila]|uniref:histidine kinase n=1 Tax=Desulfatitalea alkaliphila TaxID=2929485 RepID=A0AA41UHR7_9BACT|nr:response regulator [Desulfatitalea alkaliphila]MCJ8499920.1 response regulator [Desulfatitalea alkaliphila]
MTEDTPLYSSRIFEIYFDYLRVAHPNVNLQEILEHAGMTTAEVADTAHWFTQHQADRFYEIVAEKTGDEAIARNAGRFSASSAGLAQINQYVIGLLNTETAMLAIAKYFPMFTRGATVESRRLGPGKVEIISTPKPDVAEKPYQCENRLGTIEALPKLFTNQHGRIEHPECYHKGDGACRYIVSWETPPSQAVRLVRNYTLLGSLLVAPLTYFLTGTGFFLPLLVALIVINGGLGIAYAHLKMREMEKIIEVGSVSAEARIRSAHVSYDNSLLVQEIGRATAAIFDTEALMRQLAALMEQRLAFDRGLIMLANDKGTELVYAAGYGYSEIERNYLRQAAFQLDKPDSKGFFVRSFLDRRHLTITDANKMADALSPRSREMVKKFNVRSLLCIPILYKERPLGILAVDNVATKTPLKKSDINLLEGIASQIAISISNARSFQKLQESESRYRQTLESIQEGFFEIDPDFKIILSNHAFGELAGRSQETLIGSDFRELFGATVSRQLEGLIAQMRDTGEPVRFAHLELRGDRKVPLPVDLSASLMVDTNGHPLGYRGFLRDATDRLKMESERKELENRLLHAQKMESIGTLAGGIAHNFNNWLAGILGNITLVRMEAQHPDKLVERAMKIEQIVANAAKMNRQLLSYARGGNYEVKPTSLNALIQESSELFGATRKEIEVHLDLAPDVGAVRVDRNQIEQVFWNMYVNAIDAMPDGGGLTIRTRKATPAQLRGRPFMVTPGDHAVVAFSDSGSGIAPEHLDNIFEPFFTTKKGKGTGLGLASCYGIVKAHKGFIDVRSSKGVGTTFEIYLPCFDEAAESQPLQEDPVCKGKGTILLVDDEPMVLETSTQLLQGLGYDVVNAASGDEALARFADRAATIDLAIIDMIMPGMSGGELFVRLKSLNPAMKTLLCSGYSMNDTAREIMDKGCDGFLQKPFALSKLSETIQEILHAG